MATTIYRIGQGLLTSSSLRITRAERSEVYGDARNNSITISVGNPIGDEGDFIDGGAGNDTITAANTSDEIYGGDGADFVRANGGNDLVDGGSGNDTLDGGDGDDVVSGGTGNDVVKGGRGNDTLHGNDGDDIVDGGDGNDVMTGGLGVDTLLGGFGDDSGDGGDGNDTLVGSFGNDTLSGGLGNDLLDGGSDNDTLDGGDGDDNLLGGSGNDVLRGGSGVDFLSAADGNDLLEGGDGNDDLNAGSGDDIVHGGSGNDLAAGMAGNDTMNGDAGNDTLMGGDGADTLNGGDGDDMLVSGRPQFDPVTGQLVAFDSLDGGAGNDTADLSGYGAVDTRLLTLLNIETIITGAGNDVVFGDDLANTLNSGAGDDTIDGRGGDDILIGGAGADLLIGNGGFDTVDLSASPASDPLTGSGVTITLNGTALDPTIAGIGTGGDAEGDQYILVERFIGSAFADIFNGDELANTFVGGAGADILNGGLGSDTAEYSTSATAVNLDLRIAGPQVGAGGDAEGDTLTGMENLIGSALNDTLTGDGGLNRLEGGAGDDTLRSMGGGGASPSEFDRLIGGAGFDTADYSLATGPIRIGAITGGTLMAELNAAGTAVLTTIELDVERIVGSSHSDIMLGGTTALINNIFDGGAGADVLSGGGGDDLLIGGLGADQLQGGTGIDTVDYSSSALGVTIVGATINVGGVPTPVLAGSTTGGASTDATNDILIDVETVIGSALADTLFGNALANTFRGGDGNDRIRGGAGADILDGGNGDDLLDYSTSAAGVSVNLTTNAVSGGDATGDVISNFDSVLGSASGDVIGGNASGNTLLGGGGNDVLVSGSGDDILIGGAGGDQMDGGANIDTADYSSSALGITLVAATSGGQPIAFIGQTTGGATTDATGDVLINVENIVGSAFNDSIAGNGLANNLQGGAGIDTLSYAASTAGVTVNLSTNTVSGGYAAGDSISGFENVIGSALVDTITGDDLNNTIQGGAGGDTLNGGLGVDTADYSTSLTGVRVTILGLNPSGAAFTVTQSSTSNGDAAGDRLTSVENLVGSALDDVLTADLVGTTTTTTDNRLDGGSGNDTLNGNAGNDTLIGGAGADILNGGDGNDTAGYATSAAGVTVNLATGVHSGGDAASDTLNGIENLTGSALADILIGDAGANTLSGGDGNDTLSGGVGADQLVGGTGTDTADYATSAAGVTVNLATGVHSGGDAAGDTLSGIENVIGSALADILTGDGLDNLLRGGAGADTMVGGAGNDTADYSASLTGVTINAAAAGGGVNAFVGSTTGGATTEATGDTLQQIENLTGSAFSDVFNGNILDNVLRSGNATTGESLRGGSGADLLIANGTTTGTRNLIGEGVGDGGVAGADTFRSLAGFNIIQGYQMGERIELDEATAQREVVTSGNNYFYRLDTDTTSANGGATTETWVFLGSTAMGASAAATLASQIDTFVIVDPLFIA